MSPSWVVPLLAAVGVLAAFELAYLAYRKRFPRLLERLRYHAWGVAVAAWVGLRLWRGPIPSGTSPAAWVELAAVVLTVYLLWRIAARLWLSQARDERGRLIVPKLVRDLVGWLLLFVAIAVAGNAVLGLDYAKFLLPSAVVSAVLGFALQDVLKNVFAGLALQLEATFETGDWLLVDGNPRQVIEMSWRSTHLRDNLGHDYREPNANLANARIENLGPGMSPMGFEIEVGVVYGAPPRQVKDALERAAANAPSVVATPPPVGLLTAFGDSGVIYRLRFWSRNVQSVARLLDEVRSRVWYELKRQGFVIPFPIRTVEHASQRDLAAEQAAVNQRRAAELFAQVDVLAALPEEVRARLAAEATLHHFDDRERLVGEGDSGRSLYVVARGKVQIAKGGGELDTTQVSLATLEPGDYFGELSLLTGAPRSASVSAVGAVEVFELDRDALAPILHDDPALADTLSHVLAERVAATLDRMESRRDELSRVRAVEQRSMLSRIRGFFGLG